MPVPFVIRGFLFQFNIFDLNHELEFNSPQLDFYLKETDLDGVTYECVGVWSMDVSQKWASTMIASSAEIEKRHQDILRACHVQDVLSDALTLDTKTAYKGPIITDREKAESERRLSMVQRALLTLCTAFVTNNRENQEIMVRISFV